MTPLGEPPTVWTASSIVLLAAAILNTSRAGEDQRAVHLVDQHLRQGRLTAVSGEVKTELAELSAAAAEAYAASGQSRPATLFATFALNYATLTGAARHQWRAHSLLCLSHALNGEYSQAREHEAACRELEDLHGWQPAQAFFPLYSGQILLASAALNGPALIEIADSMRSAAPGNAQWQVTAASVDAMASLADADYYRAFAQITRVILSSQLDAAPLMIRMFALSLHADTLLALGEPRRALSFLDDLSAPATHSVCFNMQRAAAHLLLHENRAALASTEECLLLPAGHCYRTLSPILFRRAIAYERIGNTSAADHSFEQAIHHLSRLDSQSPLLEVQGAELLHLLDRAYERLPRLHPELDTARARIKALPDSTVGRPALPALTRRETQIAQLLLNKTTYQGIASQLGTSINTIKTQMRSLYKKIGATDAHHATTILERAGFHS